MRDRPHPPRSAHVSMKSLHRLRPACSCHPSFEVHASSGVDDAETALLQSSRPARGATLRELGRPEVEVPVEKTHDMRDGRRPPPASVQAPERLEAGARTPRSRTAANADSRYAALAELQRLVGNRACDEQAHRRESRSARGRSSRPPRHHQAAAVLPHRWPRPPPGPGWPFPGKEHRILDRATNTPIVVDEVQWKIEGQHLVKRVKTALKLIPEDSSSRRLPPRRGGRHEQRGWHTT